MVGVIELVNEVPLARSTCLLCLLYCLALLSLNWTRYCVKSRVAMIVASIACLAHLSFHVYPASDVLMTNAYHTLQESTLCSTIILLISFIHDQMLRLRSAETDVSLEVIKSIDQLNLRPADKVRVLEDVASGIVMKARLASMGKVGRRVVTLMEAAGWIIFISSVVLLLVIKANPI